MGTRGLNWLILSVVLGASGALRVAATPPEKALEEMPSYIPIGVLGMDAEGTIERISPLLRNQAFIWKDDITIDEHALALKPIEGTPFYRPIELLDVGAQITIARLSPEAIPVGELIDETPPERPTLIMASYLRLYEQQGCGGVPEVVSFDESKPGTLSVDFEAGDDDYASPAELTYLVFIGETEEAALEAEESVLYLIAASEGHLADLRHDWALMFALEEARFIAIEAVDRAGNKSERSEPIELIHRLGIVN